MTPSGSVPAGTRVGRYEIESLIREGGMGEVYAAHDFNLGRRVALKILPRHRTSDPERVARFVREARASSALNHPSIVAVHDAGNEGDVHFLAMELIDGQPLSEWKRKRRSVAARARARARSCRRRASPASARTPGCRTAAACCSPRSTASSRRRCGSSLPAKRADGK